MIKNDESLSVNMNELVPIMKEILSSGRSIYFAPRGISMLPMLRPGIDGVLLSPLPNKLKKYDLPLYQRSNGKYILHRIVEAGDTYTCMGDNQFVMERGLTHDQMIAVVTSFYRGEREHRTEELSYQLYCRLWYHSRHIRHFWRRGIGWLRRHIWRK